MAKIKTEHEKDNCWTRWISPIMDGYKIVCCDCGLVHDLEMKAVKVTKKNKDGSWEYKELDTNNFRIVFRAKRNNRSTGQCRRWKHNH